MKLQFRRRKQPDSPQPPEGEEREALKNEQQFIEEQGSISAIFKKMGRENLDGPFRRE
jgi:hypothetical protein